MNEIKKNWNFICSSFPRCFGCWGWIQKRTWMHETRVSCFCFCPWSSFLLCFFLSNQRQREKENTLSALPCQNHFSRYPFFYSTATQDLSLFFSSRLFLRQWKYELRNFENGNSRSDGWWVTNIASSVITIICLLRVQFEWHHFIWMLHKTFILEECELCRFFFFWNGCKWLKPELEMNE